MFWFTVTLFSLNVDRTVDSSRLEAEADNSSTAGSSKICRGSISAELPEDGFICMESALIPGDLALADEKIVAQKGAGLNLAPHHLAPHHLEPHHLAPHHLEPHHLEPHNLAPPKFDSFWELIIKPDDAKLFEQIRETSYFRGIPETDMLKNIVIYDASEIFKLEHVRDAPTLCDIAITKGSIDVLKLLQTKEKMQIPSEYTVSSAITAGNLGTVKWTFEEFGKRIDWDKVVEKGSYHGPHSQEMIKYLMDTVSVLSPRKSQPGITW
ncbi:hypothetical protein PSACC_00149 [Paramicrosporidium saccamoebae]|uniref:Uncharacterized protein n=1 Tax=Paramicrosporidium saccamoebae TaxID=1246581 RepID=A0A2H9TQI5_9FUNG|nr:hypothetical protein PSACC_00149 [Paramicrosporidium saccamoebae]